MSESPYAPPKSQITALSSKQSRAISIGAVVSLLLFTGVIFGKLGTVLGMVQAFSALASSGEADPVELANGINAALLTTLWGWVLSVVGLSLILIYHYKVKFRAKWFYSTTVTLAGITCLFFPLGSITGGITLWIFIRSHNLYFPSADDLPC